MQASATFEVTGWDQETWDDAPGGKLSLARVSKTFTGEVEGTSEAQVLAAETRIGPAAYTAQERFTGRLADRSGSFVAQHGASTPGQTSEWHIVEGSGTDELTGIRGTAALQVTDDGVHSITFTYELEPSEPSELSGQ